ncbi:hypothetical protein H0H92_000254, partial [Tricholoma furcatifolium]
GSLRKRFGNALVWYNSLKDQVANFIQSSLSRTRQTLLNLDDGVDVSDEFEEPDPFSSPLGRSVDLPHTTDEEAKNRDGADTQEDATANPFPDPPPR